MLQKRLASYYAHCMKPGSSYTCSDLEPPPWSDWALPESDSYRIVSTQLSVLNRQLPDVVTRRKVSGEMGHVLFEYQFNHKKFEEKLAEEDRVHAGKIVQTHRATTASTKKTDFRVVSTDKSQKVKDILESLPDSYRTVIIIA